jgi:L-lysine 2,3-aminomutase
VAKLLTKSNNSNVYKVCAEKRDGSGHLNNISDSSIFLNTIKQIKKLHTLFYEKLDEYYFLKRVDPGNPECEDLRLQCISLGEESEKLVDSLFQV